MFFLCRVWQRSRQLQGLGSTRVLQSPHSARAGGASADLLFLHLDTALLTGLECLLTQRCVSCHASVQSRAPCTCNIPSSARLERRALTRQPSRCLTSQRTSFVIGWRGPSTPGCIMLVALWSGRSKAERRLLTGRWTQLPSDWATLHCIGLDVNAARCTSLVKLT